jgi:3-hydroxyisobutyrate dehydrogenase-like beta-hydroxyacid dehydrogenase
MKIAIVGVGKLGSGFAEACCAKGLHVTVWNRTKDKTRPFFERGAKVAERAVDAIESADVILSVLLDADVVSSVFGEESVKRALSGKTLINVTSTSSVEAKRLQAFVKEAGGHAYLDVATTSWPPEIAQGKGTILLGCSEVLAARWSSLLETFGTVQHVGDVGSASTLELSFLMQLFAQLHMYLSACALTHRQGLPIDTLALLVENNSVFSSPLYSAYTATVRVRSYTPALVTVGHYAHGIRLVIEELESVGMDTSVWSLLLKAAQEAVAMKGTEADWTSIYESLR